MHRVLGELLQVVDGVRDDDVLLLLQGLRGLGVVQELRRALRLAVPDVVAHDVPVPDAFGRGLEGWMDGWVGR